MNLRHLRAFVNIADAGGFARAANRMNLSQPALSRQIRALETELGVPLFDRLGRRVRLTSEGEDLLRRGRRLLTEADSLGERARLLKAGETGILRVGATPQVIENMLANFLTQYRRRHPAVEVHLVEDGGVRLPSRLERGDVHLAFTPASGRFESRLLYPMHVLAALPSTHRLGRRATLEIAELAEEPLLLLRRDFGSREWFDAACSIAHIQPRVLLESAAPHTLIAFGRDWLRHRDRSLQCTGASWRCSCHVAGSPRRIGRKVGRDSVGSAAVLGSVCRALRQGDRGLLPTRLPRPRSHPRRAAVAQAKIMNS